jgi:hypothetical protein
MPREMANECTDGRGDSHHFKTRMNIPPSPFKTQSRVTGVSWQQLDWREPEATDCYFDEKKE